MTQNQGKIDQLLERLEGRLEALTEKQEAFTKEINAIRSEVYRLRGLPGDAPVAGEQSLPGPPVKTQAVANADDRKEPAKPPSSPRKAFRVTPEIEKFIGENLISKIGILITVIGVGIGARYAIDHQLISPLTRVVLGYLVGIGLLGFAIRLKKRYEGFSAVLLGGALAVVYFITYAAYSFYGLIPQLPAFLLMVLFTGFAVVAAINYNRQVIAHIGLVGAYAVPFLLSDGSGRVEMLFGYMAIINAGILFIAVRKYWKPLYYVSFIMTWLIYTGWYLSEYQPSADFVLALVFLSVFFVIFYVVFLAYKLLRKDRFVADDIVLLLSNAFVCYGLGYSIFSHDTDGAQLLGLFTLCNAGVHFMVSAIIYRLKLADRNMFYMVAGLVLVFITIAIPVQLDGNWVTLLWVGEAALLFRVGRTRNILVYEKISYPLMFLAFFSLIHDWTAGYIDYPEEAAGRIVPFFNTGFLTALLFVAAFVLINVLNHSKKYPSPLSGRGGWSGLMTQSIPAILLIVLYFTFRIEIAAYWDRLYLDSKLSLADRLVFDDDLLKFKTVWIINYSLLFLTILAYVNIKKLKNRQLGRVNLALSAFAMAVFLVQGLYVLSELRESFTDETLEEYYHVGAFNIGIRYFSFAFAGALIVACYHYTRQEFLKARLKPAFDLLLHGSLLWMVSSELVHWLDLSGSTQSYKLGLSILWGAYALWLIVIGIWRKNKHIRVGAMVLFGITLVKLFFYDISHLDTIAKTIVFVSLGILLLIISFLYNKYRHLIAEDTPRS